MTLTYQYHYVNNIRLHVGHLGMQNKEIIIFLHGFPEFSYGWKNQAAFFARQGYHVVIPDQRGYNLSSKPKGTKAYALNLLVEDIAALVRNLTKGQVVVAGHEWGGAVAWTLAQYHPHLLRKLVILNMPHLQVMKKNLETNSGQMLKSWYTGFFQFPKVPEFFCRVFDFKFLAASLSKTANPGTFSNADIAAYKKSWRQANALSAMINWYRAYKANTLNTDLQVDVPVLVIWGSKDKFLGRQMAYQSIEKCTAGKLIVLDDATHWLHHEQPQIVNAHILDFIRG